MDYLFVLNLMAHHPRYAFAWQYVEPATIDDYLALRKEHINDYVTFKDDLTSYRRCSESSASGRISSAAHCEQHGMTLGRHEAVVVRIEKELTKAERGINKTGRKIERLMRKAGHA